MRLKFDQAVRPAFAGRTYFGSLPL